MFIKDIKVKLVERAPKTDVYIIILTVVVSNSNSNSSKWRNISMSTFICVIQRFIVVCCAGIIIYNII